MSQTGQEYVCDKALCRCDKGTLPMPLTVTGQQSHFLQGRLVATMAELCTWLAAIGGPAVSQSTLWRAVQALDWRRKKSASTPLSATPGGS